MSTDAMNRRGFHPWPNGAYDQRASMSSTEERRDRQRQEARAQREMNTRGNSSPSPDIKEAMFTVVPKSPTAGSEISSSYVSEILGDFSLLVNHRNTDSLIGADQQPPTPAPVPSSHIHDPDTYSPPLPPPISKSSSSSSTLPSSHYSNSHRSHHHNGAPNSLVRAKGPQYLPPTQKPSSHNNFMEEMKRSHKSGPGPGTRLSHLVKESLSESASLPLGRTRPQLHERINKDPQVLKIMSEMNDVKPPVSALLTPRPDHQSTFTFPAPIPPPTTAQGFRVPRNPHARGKPPDKPKPNKALESCLHDEVQLSEDSDDEVSASKFKENGKVQKQDDSCKKRNVSISEDLLLSEDSELEVGSICRQTDNGSVNGFLNSVGISSNKSATNILQSLDDDATAKLTTDESSNSEDSSGSDSEESSSSDEEGKQSLPPPSPTQSDTNHWNLETIFQQSNNNKAESPKPREVTSKGYVDTLKDCGDTDLVSQLPDHVDEPAPPVVTTMPSMVRHKKRVDERPGTKSHGIPTTDESSDEGDHVTRPTPKAQRTAGGRPSVSSNYSRTRHLPSAKNKPVNLILSPAVNEEPSHSGRFSAAATHQIGFPEVPRNLSMSAVTSPRDVPRVPVKKHSPNKLPKKQETRLRGSNAERVKSRERVPSGVDSDSDGDVMNGPQEKSPKRRASPRIPPIKHNKKPSESPMSNQKSPKVINMGRSPLPPVNEVASHQMQKLPEPRVARIQDKQHKDVDTLSSTKASSVAEPVTLINKKSKGERPHTSKVEKKKRRSRRDNCSSDLKLLKNENSWAGCGDGSSVDKSKLEGLPSASLVSQTCLSPPSRKGHINSKVSSANIQYENGVPKLLCYIPLSLIDRLPSKYNRSAVEKKVNKEVLEMRTSGEVGKGKKKERNSDTKSPPNEDETKLRAICSIYKKRPSSLEPDKIKHKVKVEPAEGGISKKSPANIKAEVKVKTEPAEGVNKKSPANVKVEDNHKITQDAKTDIKEEVKSCVKDVVQRESSLKRRGSTSSLSSLGAASSVSTASHRSKRHKKEKRKDQPACSENIVEKETNSVPEKSSSYSKRRKPLPSAETEPQVKKRSRESSCEKGTQENLQGTPSHAVKKIKPFSDQVHTSPSPTNSHVSPHPRNSQRLANEERPLSAMSSDHYPHTSQSYHHSRTQDTQQSSQLTPKCSSMGSPYLNHESEEDAHIGESHSQTHQMFGLRRTPVEENQSSVSGDGAAYRSLPSSEHESRVGASSAYRIGDECVSPHPDLLASQQLNVVMYPSVPNMVSGSSTEYAVHMMNQETAPGIRYRYISPLEKKIPEISKDHELYLIKAKELKHQADKSHHRDLQAVMYLEAVSYFILTGEVYVLDPSNYRSGFRMFSDTLKLIEYVSSPFRKSDGHSSNLSLIIATLSLRCRSLLSYKLYSESIVEYKDPTRTILDYLKNFSHHHLAHQSSTPSSTSAHSAAAGGGTPSGVAWGGSQRSAANNSPSSLSPTPSPAGSVGSEGSQSSSGYSTEEARQHRVGHAPPSLGLTTPPHPLPNPQGFNYPPDFHNLVNMHMMHIFQAHIMWDEANEYINNHDAIKDFFIKLDQKMGPITFHSSLRELVPYVQEALDTLKKTLLTLPSAPAP